MVKHMFDMMRLVSMRTCFSIRGEYVTHMKIQGSFRDFSVLSYIGQCDLHNTCFSILQVWYTPGR